MKKRIVSPLLALIICLFSVLPVFAVTERPVHIIDENGMLSESEFDELEELACDIENRYGYTVLFCMSDYIDSSVSTYDYGKRQFERLAGSANGVALTINTKEELYSFYVSGDGEKVFPEKVQDEVLWAAYDKPDSYYDSIKAYLKAAEKQLKAAGVTEITTVPVTVDPNLPTERLLPLVVDEAKLLSDEEEKELTERLEAISDRFELDLAVVTVTGFGEKTPEAFADDFYDYNGYGRGEAADGALLVYKPGKQGDRRLQISTCGKAIEAFSDADISYILGCLKDDIIDENYIGAFKSFADLSEKKFETEFEPSVSLFWIPVCLAVGFFAAFIIMKVRTNSLKSVRKKTDAGDYASGVAITGRNDAFLYRNVNKTPIPKNTGSGGGGGGTHISSSGRSHGGGGTSF